MEISSEEYLNQAYQNNVITLTFSPPKLGIGIVYISKPIFELYKPISVLGSIEYGKYSTIDVKILKFGLGSSIIIQNFNLNISICYNKLKTNIIEKIAEPISIEIGLMTKVNKLYFSLYVDPINYESKIGISLGF